MMIVKKPGHAPEPEVVGKIQERLGYVFNDPLILVDGLTHSSYANEHADLGTNNERLEFLGDAVLDLVISKELYGQFSKESEGVLSKMRAAAVKESSLAELSRRLNLGEFLLLGKGEDSSGGRDKDSLLADSYEALVGAIFLDGGFDAVSVVIEAHFNPIMESIRASGLERDYKTRLQEWTQSEMRGTPTYRMVGESGPDHKKMFQVQLLIGDQEYSQGEGKSKKEAEQDAARMAIEKLLEQAGAALEETDSATDIDTGGR